MLVASLISSPNRWPVEPLPAVAQVRPAADLPRVSISAVLAILGVALEPALATIASGAIDTCTMGEKLFTVS